MPQAATKANHRHHNRSPSPAGEATGAISGQTTTAQVSPVTAAVKVVAVETTETTETVAVEMATVVAGTKSGMLP